MLTGPPRRAAVVGSPVGHSRSPVLHRAAYAALGLDWRYDAVEVVAGALPGFLDGLDAAWVGLSLTMPLKPAAASLAVSADDVVRATGVANTLVRVADGWAAANTDAPGLRRALAETGWLAGGRLTVLGAGATAASTLWALGPLVDEVTVLARDASRAASLHDLAAACGATLAVLPLDDRPARLAALAADLVVSTTPASALDHLAADVALAAHPSQRYLDWVYAPWPTPLAVAYLGAGAQVVGGALPLLHQAALQVELMTGRSAPVEAMRAALAQS